MNSTIAAVLARTETERGFHPRLVGALIALGGLVLLISGLRGRRDDNAA